MPQLDLLLLISQSNIFLFFILGYLLFIKFVLPIICFFLKIKNKIILDKYKTYIKLIDYQSKNARPLILYNYTILATLAYVYKFYAANKVFKIAPTFIY